MHNSADVGPRAARALRALRALQPLRASRPLRASQPLRTAWPLRALRPLRAALPSCVRHVAAVLLATSCLIADLTVGAAQSRGRQQPAPPPTLDDVVHAALEEQHIPGAVVALVQADSVLLIRAYGRTALDAAAPALDGGAVFRAAALTELVSALAATTLAADGRLSLDRAVGAGIPGVPQELRGVTPAQLLSHTAGLARFIAVPGRGGANDLGAAARGLTRFDRVTDPGLLYSYSVPGRALSALVIERAAGRPYAEAVRSAVFVPLGMHDSTLALEAVEDRLTPGWRSTFMPGDRVGRVRPLPDSAVHVPVRGLYSTAADLARLAAAVLNDGIVAGERVLPEGAAAAVWHVRGNVPAVPAQGVQARDAQAATGVRIGTWEERPSVRIAGGETGYSVLLQLLQQERVGVVVLTNNESAATAGIADFALRQLLELPVREPARRAPPQDVDTAAATARLLAHAGPYENGSELLEIVNEAGAPMLRSDELLLPVRPLGADTYGVFLDETRVGLVFRLIEDERGRTYLWLGDRALSPDEVRRAPPR
jgi:CubicO group peptidase (beta-lactamase class C family)